MGETLLKVLPVMLGFVGGFLLRRFRVAEPRDGDFLFRLVFYVCVPALMFTSLSTVQITAALAVFPLSSALFTLVGFVLAGLVVVAALILTIIAGVKASEGVDYRYPFTWRPLR